MILHGDCLDKLKELQDNSVDCLVTDPPYGINFMGKNWDNFEMREVKLLSNKTTTLQPEKYSNQGMIEFFTPRFKECLRVMKPGSFGFIMCIPRQDCLSRMMIALENAGFNINFTSLYWTYATGFPKALNVGKKEESLKGSYGGFQPKPAVEVIIVVMKPLEESGYLNQAMKNGKGVTWLDDCRIPYVDAKDEDQIQNKNEYNMPSGFSNKEILYKKNDDYFYKASSNGRFPANLLISDVVLNDVNKFFSLDSWSEKNLPFLIVPKAPKTEKNAGCELLNSVKTPFMPGLENISEIRKDNTHNNNHPTVKPMKLMSYLITLGSKQGDVILDPFSGSFTTACSAIMLRRNWVGIEKEDEYIKIGEARTKHFQDLKNNEPLKV